MYHCAHVCAILALMPLGRAGATTNEHIQMWKKSLASSYRSNHAAITLLGLT